MSKPRKAKPREIIDFLGDEVSTTLCLIVPRPVGLVIQQMMETGLWGNNIPDTCERIISHWILSNLKELSELGIRLKP